MGFIDLSQTNAAGLYRNGAMRLLGCRALAWRAVAELDGVNTLLAVGFAQCSSAGDLHHLFRVQRKDHLLFKRQLAQIHLLLFHRIIV